MDEFYSRLFVEKISAYKWRLVEDFKTPLCTVPKGFVTDGASNARIFWSIINPAGRFFEAAIVHDYMIDNHSVLDIDLDVAHWAFYETAIDYGAKNFVALTAYYFIKFYFKYKDLKKCLRQQL